MSVRCRLILVFLAGCACGLLIAVLVPRVWAIHQTGGVLRELETQVNRTPNDAVSWSLLGNAYANLGQREEAVRAYRRALAINDRDLVTYLALADVLLLIGRGQQAHDVLLKGRDIARSNDVEMVSMFEFRLREMKVETN